MEARLKWLIQTGAIEVDPLLPRGWHLQRSGFEFSIKIPEEGCWPAATRRYRIRRPGRSFGRAKTAPSDTRIAQSSTTTEPKKKGPQFNRAKRYIKKNYPHGTNGITTAAIRRKLVNGMDLQTELDGRAVPSLAVINRVLGRRQT
jgi:hypothetical protein